MLETLKFVRKPFHIDGVQVTPLNINDIAEWCGGEVRSKAAADGVTLTQYIKVEVRNPLSDRQTQAFIGDWVLYAGTGFKVYTPKAFSTSFDQVGVETTMHMTGQKKVQAQVVEVVVQTPVVPVDVVPEVPVDVAPAVVPRPVPGPPFQQSN